jgi:FAD/FMN-containing dehydrogenase/Fe-S oxidoreductase
MDDLRQHRDRVLDDLRGLVSGDVRCDDAFLQLFASDASLYEIQPLAVVRPQSTGDVVACVQYAAEKGIPIHARGAGSGLAGGALGPGLVVDFSKYLRRVVYTGEERVRVQAGLVCERLNAHLRARGRQFGPDPAASAVTTLGGMIAVDASGSRRLRYGSVRDHVLSLQIVLSDGQLLEVGREPLDEKVGANARRKGQLVGELHGLLARHGPRIRQERPRSLVNRCGYELSDLIADDHLHLARLLVGSRGTLALVTEAVLATQPLPRHRGMALLLFDSMEKACRAVPEILRHCPTACDLMDRRHLILAKESEVRFDLLIPAETEALLLVEHEGTDALAVRDRLHRLIDDMCQCRRWAFGSRQAFDRGEIELFWQLARHVQPAAYRVKGARRPVPVVEEVAIPPEILPEFVVCIQNLLKRHQITASLFGHAGHGVLHVYPFLDVADPDEIDKMRRFVEGLYAEVLDAGGTMSGEERFAASGPGAADRPRGWLYEVFRQVKRVFDPPELFNPGKVVGGESAPLTGNIRRVVASPGDEAAQEASGASGLRDLVELQLNWDPGQVADAARQCHGCGECRTQRPDVRMCPIFRALPSEEASPRAKANLIRGVLTGQLDLSRLTTAEFKEMADLCVHCHMCRLECPSRVDVPKLMVEGKGAYVAANGLHFGERVLARIDLVSAIGSRLSPVVNWALGNRQMRWLLEKTLGLAQGRKLPRLVFISRTFVRRAARRRLTRHTRRSGRKVAFFVDVYANYHDPQLAEAVVAVLEHNGVAVYVPQEQRGAGMAAISCGALDLARRLARRNVAVFAEAVRQGYHVVTAEPAVAVCLQREYPNLLDDDDVRLVAQNSSEVCTYLWRMHTQGRLQLDLKPIHAALGYHMPCRLKALEVGSPGENLLRLIPGLSVHPIEEGCSGMAGTFGLSAKNYRTSLRIGRALIGRLRDPNLHAGTTECSACKMQMAQGTTKPTIHPIKLLAYAYGLMPEVGSLLAIPGEELTVP